MKTETYLEYYDWSLIAWLLFRGHQIVNTKISPTDKKTYYYFEATKEAKEDANKFFDDVEVTIKLKTYKKTMQDLKFLSFNPAVVKNLNPIR